MASVSQALVLLIVLSACACAVQGYDEVPTITDEEYYALPKMFELDHYEECLVRKNAAFCIATFDLTAPTQSPIYDVIKEISSYPRVYYNHTKLYRGLCVTKSCANFLNSSSLEKENLVSAMEACVNRSIHEEYGLEAKVTDVLYCKRTGETPSLDLYDYAFAILVAALVMLNIAGTIYEPISGDEDSWLAAFSLRQSWRKLTISRDEDFGDSRLHRLKSLQGFRAMSMFFVIFAHVLLIPLFNVPPDRTRFVEQMPYYFASVLLYSGYFFMQTFIVMGSFLLAYNLKIFLETQSKFSWPMFLMGVLQRYLRLIPSYMLMVLFMATWTPHLNSGPLCPMMEDEKKICRDKWWLQLFFINNIVRPSDMCMGQAWYLAVDMQLFIFGLLFLKLLWHRPHLTRPLLGTALAISTVGQFFLMYFFDLKPPQLMQTPESLRTLFKEERSFWYVYTTFQGNIQGYIVGLILGLEYYRMEQKEEYITSKRWYPWLYHLCVPLGFIWMLLIQPFLRAELPALYVALYATIDRFFFAILVAIFILGLFRRVDNVYRGLMEWRGWTVLGRLTFSALLLHVITYFSLSCGKEYPRSLSVYGCIFDWVGTIAMTYIFSVPLTLMVEYPCQRLQKMLFTTSKKEKTLIDHNGNIRAQANSKEDLMLKNKGKLDLNGNVPDIAYKGFNKINDGETKKLL